MHFLIRLILCGACCLASIASAQENTNTGLSRVLSIEAVDSALPDEPVPQDASAQAGTAATQANPEPGSSRGTTQQPLSQGAGASRAQTQQEKAERQLREEERQRVLGVVPNFNTTYRHDAVSLTASQKMRLAFRSAIDPVTFAGAFLVAGYHEALDDDTGFRWGIEGYGKRAGAAYLDAFDGTIIGNGILPSLLRQDPRYFRLGQGTVRHRLLYAIAATVICKHDNTGRWEPNYSNVAGNILSGAISNLYYPSQESGIGETIANGLTVTAEGTISGVFDEFWPDISRKMFHKDPTHGLDAQPQLDSK